MNAAVDAPNPPLDWQRMPLGARVLIEASAGTGKTFTIGLIYLRLLLECELRVEQILVATFTDAAAQELRERLRRRLVEAEHCLQRRGAEGGDADVQQVAPADADSLAAWLATNFADAETARRALRRIQLARADIDRAPIATIHALCQRIQRDYPLESGAAFAVDKLVDETELLRECVEDFWRRRYLTGTVDAREAQAVLSGGPEGLLRDLHAMLASDATAVAADGLAEMDRQIELLRNTNDLAELRRLAADKCLYASRKTALSARLTAVADILENGQDIEDALTAKLDKVFDVGAIEEQQAADAPQRLRTLPLIVRLLRLRDLLKTRDVFARGTALAAALAYCREELPRRAQRRNAQTYSMLIDGVYARLCSADADATLAERLFEAFPAALIDEFQDTDQRQFAIFDRIYRDHAGNLRGTLAMIGDPKQAIFGFRGGDIAAYLRASTQATQRFSLAVNHRSSSVLVGALNALYGHTDGGFDDARIRYRQVQADGKCDEKPYARDGIAVATPLTIHRFRDDATIKGLGELETLALQDCAERIVELLNDPAQTIAGTRVAPGDIAVLLPTNKHIAALRELLVARRVPCVSSGRGSVFDGDVARELELILYAVLNADDDRAVRGALSTRLLGARFADIVAWQDDTQAFERELERFAAWRDLVHTRGVLALIEAVLEHRAASLLATPEGERVVTNLRHLGELLAEQESAQHGLDGLYAWFAAIRREGGEGGDAADARQLRLESDAARVSVLTVHKSKGLQFPIVFLPLVWRISDRSGQRAPKALRFHDDAGHTCIDLGSANFVSYRARHFREDLQERLRLLYVALTRAVYAVHVYWVDRDVRADDDADAWKLPAIDVLIRQAQQSLGLPPGEAALDALAQKLGGVAVAVAFSGTRADFVAVAAPDTPRAARKPLPALRPFQWLHSFSALTRHMVASGAEPAAADEADDGSDAVLEMLDDTSEDPHLLALDTWRGRRFGNAVHKVLEQAAPGNVWPQQRALLAAQLLAEAVRATTESGGDPLESVGQMIDRVRQTDLGDGLRLADLAADARVAEFEFQFPVHVGVAQLRALCAAHGCANAVPAHLSVPVLNGMLTGFADLIFLHAGRYHVLDYKTNRLGTRASDYRGAALDAAMAAHNYDLQALLYSVALHRYLRQRLDGYTHERHLGESWYLFLRAVGLQRGLGVCRRRWPPALILALDHAFAGVEGVAA
jgi:exodeoxyribonuclease V beta subunit